jgi:methyl-accepting chemotaxis protein
MILPFYRRLSLRGKLYSGLAVLCGLLGTIVVLANWCMSVVVSMSERTLHGSVHQAEITAKIAVQTLECRRFEKDVFLNVGNAAVRDEYRKKWEVEFARLRTAIEAFRAAASGAEDTATAERWLAGSARYEDAMRRVTRGVADGSIKTPEQANEAITPFKESIRTLTDEAIATSPRKMAEARRAEADLSEVVSFFRTLLLIVTAAAVLGVLLWSYVFVVDLTRPVSALCEAARRIGGGDLYTRVDLDRQDELGRLAASFNEMTARLRDHATDTEVQR